MTRSALWLTAVAMTFVAASPRARAVDVHDTLLLAQPALSKDRVAFVYAGDLWVADLDGRNVRRLTSG